MFGFLEELGKGIGSIVGSILAIPVAVVAETLGITVSMVNQAKKSGCEIF